jgi:hypothetical protein
MANSLKSIINKSIQSLTVGTNYSTGRSAVRSGAPMDVRNFGGDGVGAFFSYEGITSCVTAYEECPPLQAIINHGIESFVSGEVHVLNSKGKPSTSLQAKKVLNLISDPNPYQTKSAFLGQIYCYTKLVGYSVVIPFRPVGFPISEAESLWVVPPTMCNIVTKGNALDLSLIHI